MADIVQHLMATYPTLWNQFLLSAKDILIGLAILIVGAVLAWIFGRVTQWAVHQLEIDKRIKKQKLHKGLLGFTVAGIAKIYVEVLVFLAFLTSAVVYFHLPGLNAFAATAFFVTAELLKATLIIVATLLIGEYISNKIKASKITFANTWGIFVEVLIAVIGITIALDSITFVKAEILGSIVTVFAQGVALAFGLGLGLAFGLGGKDVVASVLKKRKAHIEEIV